MYELALLGSSRCCMGQFKSKGEPTNKVCAQIAEEYYLVVVFTHDRRQFRSSRVYRYTFISLIISSRLSSTVLSPRHHNTTTPPPLATFCTSQSQRWHDCLISLYINVLLLWSIQGGGLGPMICRLAPPTPRPGPPRFWLSPPVKPY